MAKGKGTQAQTKPDALKSSPLRKLPDRVIVQIAKCLPPASRIAFGQSCRHIYSVAGTRHISRPPWEVLELDDPDHLECYYCRDRHAIDGIYEYVGTYPKAKSKPCWKMNEAARTARYMHPDFSFTVFRMIMKRYRQGKDWDQLLQLLAYRSGPVLEGAQVKQVIATPKIVGGRLLMRLHSAYVVPPKGPTRAYLLSRNLMKCPHSNQFGLRNTSVAELLKRRFEEFDTIPEEYSEHVMSRRCYYCPTEFHFGLQHFESQGALLFITKWQDLGTGLSPLGSDLSPVVESQRDTYSPRKEGRIAYESPRDRFEGRAPDGDFQPTFIINKEERKALFNKCGTRLVQFRRKKASVRWSLWGSGQYHPQDCRVKLEKRSDKVLAVALYMEGARHRISNYGGFRSA